MMMFEHRPGTLHATERGDATPAVLSLGTHLHKVCFPWKMSLRSERMRYAPENSCAAAVLKQGTPSLELWGVWHQAIVTLPWTNFLRCRRDVQLLCLPLL
jgi:hypothetical protein